MKETEDAPLRSLRIGERLLTVSNDTVKASHLLHPGVLLDEWQQSLLNASLSSTGSRDARKTPILLRRFATSDGCPHYIPPHYIPPDSQVKLDFVSGVAVKRAARRHEQ